jgi:hypothetical protein
VLAWWLELTVVSSPSRVRVAGATELNGVLSGAYKSAAGEVSSST